MMWPCKVCKQLSTNPEGCLVHRPERPAESFEDELLRVLTSPAHGRTDGVVVSGMIFGKLDEPHES